MNPLIKHSLKELRWLVVSSSSCNQVAEQTKSEQINVTVCSKTELVEAIIK